MKVLLISHTCQSRTEGQPKAHCLAALPDVTLRVLTPDRWMNYGAWRTAELPQDAAFEFTAGHVTWPWVGPAQFYLHWYRGLHRIIREFQPDIIDLWEEPWGLVSAHAVYLRNRHFRHIKIVSETEQNTDKVLPFPFERFRRYTLKHANFAVGRNQQAIDIIRARGYTGRARVVPNAVDADLFHPMDRAQARAELLKIGCHGPEGCHGPAQFAGPCVANSDSFIVAYFGRLVEEKGLMDLVDALPLTPPNVHVLLVGSGDFQQPLLDRAAALNVAARLHILPGRPLDQLPTLMNAIDVLAIPSRTIPRWKEQFGRVIIEAHACRTPVIGSNSGAIPEVVGDCGLIFPEGDAQKLAAAIRHLHGDPKLCRDLGTRGRARVEAHFTWHRVAEQMHEIYRETLHMPPVPTTETASA